MSREYAKKNSSGTTLFVVMGTIGRKESYQSVVNLSVAVDRWTKNGIVTDWFYLKVFESNKRAWGMANSVDKGTPVLATGTLVVERWEKDGKENSRMAMWVDQLSYTPRGASQQTRQESADAAGYEDESDVPF
jgi:single-stranded DNA-binding protein